MKQTLTLIAFAILTASIATSQQPQKAIAHTVNESSVVEQESYPIPGSHILYEEEQKIRDYFKAHPEAKQLAKPRSTSWEFTVGETRNWWATNLEINEEYKVPSTCKAVGTHCYIFVADDSWTNGEVDQAAVDAIKDGFDNTTPANASKGIFEIDTETFGDPPNVDSDSKIIILIFDIKDGYEGSGGYTAGYFFSINEYPDGDPAIGNHRSNYAEIFYMDSNPANLLTENGRTNTLSITAHEFQHMIHWYHDNNERLFVNEGLSEIAMYICGYGLRSNGLYAQNTDVNLLSWGLTDNTLDDYSRAAHWTLYMLEQFPIGIMKDFVIRSHPAWGSFNGTFGLYTTERDFWGVFEDFLIANYINDISVDSRYGYNYSPISKTTPQFSHTGNLNVPATTATVDNLAAHYIEFTGGSDLTVTFTNVSGLLRTRAIKMGDNTVVEELEKNAIYTPEGYGTTYDKVTFLIYNKSDVGEQESYTYSATGTSEAVSMELAYEDNEPDGFLQFDSGDSLAVWFNGLSGAKLDSLRIAFRRTGKIQMDISEIEIPFSRGTNLYGPVNVTSPDSTVSVPYPIPYDNWVTVDLTSENIDATNDFVVSFLIGKNPAAPAVMASAEPDDGIYHSRTYTEAGTPPSEGWWIFTDGSTPTRYWNYVVRAYVSIGEVTAAIDHTGIVTIPNDFHLEQNYPNPFNPTTTFEFGIPSDGLVKFTVHDLLGREVYTEQRTLFSGNYSFRWNGQNQLNQQVVSGVYFLRMEADGFSQTKKMLLLR